MRGQEFGRQVGGAAGVEQDVVINPQQRVDGERQPRRLQLGAIKTGAAGADEMDAGQPVPGDDLRKRGFALHQFGEPGCGRID